jgi:regulatory protein YycI of two-component signal transduction system YycFG
MVSLILIPVVIAFVFFAKNSSRREVASRASHEVEALLAKNIKYETNLRKVIDENQRLSGLIVHHQQTAEALALCQNTLSNVNKAKDEVMRARQTLEVEISRLKRQLATAPSSAP